MRYKNFLENKPIRFISQGFEIETEDLNENLFDWQKKLVQWSIKKGRSALFTACGTGKSLMQLSWAKIITEKTKGNVLILAPLAVSFQTKREGEKFGIKVNIAKDDETVETGINITNYQKIDKFDLSQFVGIVLDESGILKSFTSKTTMSLIESCQQIKYKLCCTATPSPNDFTELGNTAEFLGVMTRPEMLATFFINDASNCGTWRLKGYVGKSKFWEWLSSWAMAIQKPSDIGFNDKGFDLPKLNVIKHILEYTGKQTTLFVEEASTLTERRDARKESMDDRLIETSTIIKDKPDNIFLIWCNLNVEGDVLRNGIDDIIEVKGADKDNLKEKNIVAFADGKIKRLVSKVSIMGFGINAQCCHDIIFFGLSDSFEQYYQAIRRCWRFGQKHEVNVHIVIGEREKAVLRNIERKEKDSQVMFDNMIKYMKQNMLQELSNQEDNISKYEPSVEMIIPNFL